MIAFACSQCGQKFQVKDEYAGKRAKCPACKHGVVVPPRTITEAAPAPAQIDGSASSLARAGLTGGVTLGGDGRVPAPRDGADRTVASAMRDVLKKATPGGQRYVIEGEIARGGMGAVLRAIDCDIRREVAVKYLLDQSDPHKKARFVEEAQITGQLEHPNIVPVYDLGVDAQGRPFLSMKMVRGRSLAQVLDELRTNPKTAEKEYSLGRLLGVFVNICHALAYAHSRDVVHRDLKPANIMLGDFGEVYVMDWGLAKVLASGGRRVQSAECRVQNEEESSHSALSTPHSALPARPPLAATASVLTSREFDADLTQEGAVLGTPVYMAPEQATGNVNAIDQRSDVYALGAILYEIMTLQPPIDKEGGYLAILMRAASGEIVPPEQRAPERAKAGKVPRELTAVALKAMAKQPANRYAHVEALRRDIERFQEGRSVSAKEDTVREMAWKLVRRNKAISIVSTAALLLIAFVWGRSAWITHEEQTKRREQTMTAVPAFLEAARFAVQGKKFDNALAQLNVAIEYDPDNADAHLLRGQLLIAHKKDFAGARVELEQVLQQRPNEADVLKLIELCKKVRADDPGGLAFFVPVLMKQNELTLAASMVRSRDELIALYRQRVNAAWPGLGEHLKIEDDKLTLNLTLQWNNITDLSPLRGIPFNVLGLTQCTAVKDLGPLQGMPLTELQGYGLTSIHDVLPLRGMPLTRVNLAYCHQLQDIAPLAGAPLTWLTINNTPIRDLSPLRNMPLTYLDVGNYGRVRDLTPLHDLPQLTELHLAFQPQLPDVTALQSLKLRVLDISNCPMVHDLTPLRKMPLEELNILDCGQIKDLTPLDGMHLRTVTLTMKHITKGIVVLQNMKSLKTIRSEYSKSAIPAEEFWKRYKAGEFSR